MTVFSFAQPDVTLILDAEGVIKEATLSPALASDESLANWVGRRWVDTIPEGGAEKIQHMVKEARSSRVSVFRQVNQRFPSGRELLMEYTTIRLGGKAGLIAIGRNLQAVADLQSRLISAQQAMERDYWKLRDVETRYRLLFQASTEAVLMVMVSNLRIVEANPAAMNALGLGTQPPEAAVGRELLAEVAPQERESFEAMLTRVRDQRTAPGILVHLGRDQQPWLVRASLMKSEPGLVFLLQLLPAGAAHPGSAAREAVSIEDLIERGPDGFVVLDQDGVILRANPAFLDLAQIGSERTVLGERLGRWLGRPGADLTVLLANVRRHGVVRLFSTMIHGELGTDTEVEISAAGSAPSGRQHVGMLMRDVSRKLRPPSDGSHLGAVLGSLTEQIGKTSLRKLVQDTVGVVERHYIEAALELTGGNRTAAAEILGLSRQSLYAKLDRYDLAANDAETRAGSHRPN